jgi:hypothetical protein
MWSHKLWYICSHSSPNRWITSWNTTDIAYPCDGQFIPVCYVMDHLKQVESLFNKLYFHSYDWFMLIWHLEWEEVGSAWEQRARSSRRNHKQARKQRGTGTLKTKDERAWLNKITAIFLKKQLLTLEDGQFRPKHVVILKILKSDNYWEHYKGSFPRNKAARS